MDSDACVFGFGKVALRFCSCPSVVAILRAAVPLVERTRANAHYAIDMQNNAAMPKWRYDVTEWLIEVGKAYRFHFETVSATVSLLDRVLSQAFVPSELMQGSALACMFLASKLHERRPLALRDVNSLAGIADPQKTINELQMKILCLLRYDVNSFTVANCVAAVASCIAGPGREAFAELGLALAHLALKSYDFLQFSPFAVALALVSAMLAEAGQHAQLFPCVQRLYAEAGLEATVPRALQAAAVVMLQVHRGRAPPSSAATYAGVTVGAAASACGGGGVGGGEWERGSGSGGSDSGGDACGGCDGSTSRPGGCDSLAEGGCGSDVAGQECGGSRRDSPVGEKADSGEDAR